MQVDTLINELNGICNKGQVGASSNRIRKIRKLLEIFQVERHYPWYLKLALYFNEKR